MAVSSKLSRFFGVSVWLPISARPSWMAWMREFRYSKALPARVRRRLRQRLPYSVYWRGGSKATSSCLQPIPTAIDNLLRRIAGLEGSFRVTAAAEGLTLPAITLSKVHSQLFKILLEEGSRTSSQAPALASLDSAAGAVFF